MESCSLRRTKLSRYSENLDVFIMASSRRDIVAASLLVLLTAALLYRVAPYMQVHNVRVGDRAPEFNLTSDEGRGVRLADFRGKFVLLNFWATWCPPCVEELPSLNALHQRYDGKDLIVLGVSIDEDAQEYGQFLDRWDVRFPTVRDPERRASTMYGTVKYPETYLIDREGTVIRKYVGPQDWSRTDMVNYFDSLL